MLYINTYLGLQGALQLAAQVEELERKAKEALERSKKDEADPKWTLGPVPDLGMDVDMDAAPPQPQAPAVDEDGFMEVVRNRRRR
jgi:hypothetical protein